MERIGAMQEEQRDAYLEAIEELMSIPINQLRSYLDEANSEIELSSNSRMLDESMEWVRNNPQTSFALNPENMAKFVRQVRGELPEKFTLEEYVAKAYTTLLAGLDMMEGVVVPSKFRDYVLE